MFAISRCPSCKRLHGLQVPVATTTCRSCGRRYDTSKGTIVRSFVTDIEMRAYLQGMKSIEGGSEDPMAEIDTNERTRDTSGPRRGKGRAINMVLEVLRTGPRTWEDMVQYTEGVVEVQTLEEGLKSLMEEGIVFRTKDGSYSLVV